MSRKPARKPVLGPGLRRLLWVVFALFALLTANSVYLAVTTLTEYLTGQIIQNLFYQYMFLLHLALGLLLIAPFLIYAISHMMRAKDRPNRRAVMAGYGVFILSLLLLISGLVLTRWLSGEGVDSSQQRGLAYWIHVISPLLVVWAFVLHRLAGKRIRWRLGVAVLLLTILPTAAWLVHSSLGAQSPSTVIKQFQPSLLQLHGAETIPPERMMTDDYCAECHGDIHQRWQMSAHRLSSFNNPAYRFSVEQTRAKVLARDGNVQASRFCASCHDVVPLLAGEFDRADFDGDSVTAQAGLTCVSCHAVTAINSPRGNTDFVIEDPPYYPFTFSDQPVLAWLNRALIKAKPAFHKKSLLKPLHQTPEFCGGCHKVHIPEALNAYRWLRGQNHYDSFHLSGVSGHSVSSFYYPPKAHDGCNGCHMPWQASDDFAARRTDDGETAVHDHLFPGANTAIPVLTSDQPEEAVRAHQEFLKGSATLDVFALREGGVVDGQLLGPVGEQPIELQPGQSYLLELVIRTRTLGHLLTQGTADSNELWVELSAYDGDLLIGSSGRIDPQSSEVDRRAHFVNSYVLDRNGDRINQRNAEDIFTGLYNHQIPPGAADSVHYYLELPESFQGPLIVNAALKYRKFDAEYTNIFSNDPETIRLLPVTTIDNVEVQIGDAPQLSKADPLRWNDYGIGLLLKPGKGQLRQAEEVFKNVAELGSPHGWVNLARTYLREGRLDDTRQALTRAAQADDLPAPWTVTWLSAQVDRQFGQLDAAINAAKELLATPYPAARDRGFDFSQDYRVIEFLAQVSYERARQLRSPQQSEQRTALLEQAAQRFNEVLVFDPERAASHYGLAQVYGNLGREELAEQHRQAHQQYKVDDNARDKAIAAARLKDPIAARAADDVVIYLLNNPNNKQSSEEATHVWK